MKLSVLFLLSAQAIDEDKKVPSRHPLQRLKTLTRFSKEWCRENLKAKQANHWAPKFERNAIRMETRFRLCGFYDPSLPNGGPRPTNRKRRTIDFESHSRTPDDDVFSTRYDKTNPAEGINDIITGFKKWAQRYLADCKLQPGRQEHRLNKWREVMIIKSLLNDDGGSGESELEVSM